MKFKFEYISSCITIIISNKKLGLLWMWSVPCGDRVASLQMFWVNFFAILCAIYFVKRTGRTNGWFFFVN